MPPAQAPLPGSATGSGPRAADGMNPKERFCYQLEQKLVQSSTQGNQARDQLPRIDQEMRQLDKAHQQAKMQLDRNDCWETFLFSKTLKRTRQCVDLNRQADESRQRLADLEAQRQSIVGTRSAKSTQDELIDALARNGCGANYQQEAARRERQGGGGFPWGGGDDEESEGGNGMRRQGALPFNTYRTVCVRLCDGYYFPVSFSTMQSQFPKDAQVCSSKCAAPAELFYYQNPGGEIEQATSIGGQPYSKLPNAFRHRKEVVQGCSCRSAEYQPELLGQKGQRRAEPAPAQNTVPVPVAPKKPPVKAAATPAAGAGSDQDLIAQTIERTKPAVPAPR